MSGSGNTRSLSAGSQRGLLATLTPYLEIRAVRLVLSVGGLFLFFLLYGVVQERIMTKPYGFDDNGDPEYFTSSAFLVLNNRLVTVAIATWLAIRKGESLKNIAPLHNYFGASISNFVATLCQYEALKYVTFPTQTLGKCGKMVPILVLGTLGLGARKYGAREYFQGLVVTVGVFIFFMTGETKAPQSQKDESFGGIMLMLAYLFCDGFTSTLQERMFRGFTMSMYNQMIYINASSAILSILTLVVSDQLFSSIAFCFKYPAFFWDAFGLSLCAMFGQQVIYFIIKEFGALIFATAMTTRQFVAILLSWFVYTHPLSIWQWLSTVCIFAVLYWEAVDGKKKKAGHGHGGGHGSESTEGKPESQKIDVNESAGRR